MSTMTLEQLKAENTSEVEAPEALTPELEVVETEEVAEVVEVETEEAGELAEGETTNEPVEAWMQTEGETSEGEQQKGPSFKGLKQKLKGKIADRDDEIANLRSEIDALKSGTVQTQQPTAKAQPMPRPKREDYDFDDDRFDEATDLWHDARQDARQDAREQKTNQATATKSNQSTIAKAVDQHYENAAALVADGKVTEEAYRGADLAVRSAIESVMPNQGDTVSDFLISRLNGAGEGSDKVWFHLGRNPEALSVLRTKLANDPMGIDAAMYLGDLRRKVTASPAKRVSQAPAPGSKLKGDATQSTSASALQKKYNKAGNDVQARINIKREAKAAGINTKLWS